MTTLFKLVQSQAVALYSGLSIAGTSMRVTPNPTDLDGTKLTMSDFGGVIGYATIDPGIPNYEEIVSFTGITDNGDGTATLTGLTRNLISKYPYTTAGTGKQHGASAVVVFSDNPQVYNKFGILANDQTWTGQNIFSGYAPQTDTDPVAGNDIVRLSYVQALVLGTLTTIDVKVPGVAGETLTDGQLVYLKNADNRWWKCDADTASTVNNVLLGIAQGAGTAGNQITNGVLLQGVDDAQSGRVAGEIQYASNTAGGISNTPGTTEVTVGIAKSATELYFSPRFNQMLTEDQQDAMDGANSPSALNVFLTANDSSSTPSANKLAKYDANGGLSATNITATYPLGESFTGATTPQPAVVIDDLLQPLFDGTVSYGAAASPQVATKIIPRGNATISSIVTLLTRASDPGTNMSIEIQTDNAGAPSGTPVTNGTSATIATSTLKNNEYRYFNFTFGTPPAIVSGTTYWIVFKTSATNANQITVASLTNAKKYGSFSGSTYNGSAWTANQTVPYFEAICATGGSKSLWVADGNAVEPLGNYHGFCITTGSAGTSATLVKQGVVGGFSSLAVNSDYYISNTVGTLTLNKDEGCYAGTALSASTLLIPPVKGGTRNTNYYLTLPISGEAGNSWFSVPYYAYESGTFTIYGTASVKNSTRTTLTASIQSTYANATMPSGGTGIVTGMIQTYDASIDGAGCMVIPVRKGDRIQVGQSNAGGAGNAPSLSSVTFTPRI